MTQRTQELSTTAWYRYSNFFNTIAAVSAAAIDLGQKPAAHYRARWSNVDDYLKVRLAAFTTSAKFVISESIRFLNASPVGPPGFTAIF